MSPKHVISLAVDAKTSELSVTPGPYHAAKQPYLASTSFAVKLACPQ